jgi:hypothetical protein
VAREQVKHDLAAGVPICGFTGRNGAGKTTLAVQSAIADMARGRDVYSTVHITSAYGESKPILTLRQLLELRDATILFDDVSAIFSSRSTASLPGEIVTLLQVLRHRNLTVRWTAPAWMRCDNLLREVTQDLVNVQPMFRVSDGSPWPRPRLLMVALHDTSVGAVDATPEKILRRELLLPKKLDSFGAFDTHADTPIIGGRSQSGFCVDCGGTITREKHSPQRHAQLGLPWFDDDGVRVLQVTNAVSDEELPRLEDVVTA